MEEADAANARAGVEYLKRKYGDSLENRRARTGLKLFYRVRGTEAWYLLTDDDKCPVADLALALDTIYELRLEPIGYEPASGAGHWHAIPDIEAA